MAETPRFAHFVILVLVGAELGAVVSAVALLFGLAARRQLVARLAASALGAIVFGYAAVLLGVGAFSRQHVLAPGEWKYFCEADCHIAYSISGVRQVAPAEGAPAATLAGDRRIVVRVTTWFDPHSIAPWRGNGPLSPGHRSVVLMDSAGHIYPPLSPGAAGASPASTPLATPLRPGQTYSTDFAFDVPPAAQNLRLWIGDTASYTRFVIDQENSPFHGKILLALNEAMPL